MFQRILVAADTLGRSSRALYVAQQLAARVRAQLLVLHVETNNTFLDLTADERELRGVVRAMRAQGLDARFVLDYGRPDECIAKTVARERVDLVVMAPHNRGLIESIRKPSVTQSVLAQGDVPVLAWPQHISPQLDASLLHLPSSLVVVPLDGSRRAEEALSLARTLAAQFRRNLLLLQIVPSPAGSGRSATPPAAQAVGLDYADAEARAYLAEVRSGLLATSDGTDNGIVQVETMVKHGDPTAEIARTAELHPGSLIVISTRGRGELARLMLGSVTEGVIRAAPTPVLIAPPKLPAPSRARLRQLAQP